MKKIIIIGIILGDILALCVVGFVRAETKTCLHTHTEILYNKGYFDPTTNTHYEAGKWPTEVCDE